MQKKGGGRAVGRDSHSASIHYATKHQKCFPRPEQVAFMPKRNQTPPTIT